jgi:hypothetical protein
MRELGKRTIQVGVTLGAIVGLIGCSEQGADVSAEEDSVIFNDNGLAAVNGFSIVNGFAIANGLNLANGLNIANGLSVINGLSVTNGLMTTSDGRRTVGYMARCALNAGDSMVKNVNGTNFTFTGGLGLCPTWKNAGVMGDNICQERVSACMMALINAAGVRVPVVLDAQAPSIGWGRNPSYPNQEGTFFGNMMVKDAHGVPGVNAYFCEGPNFAAGVVPGRIGIDQGPTPYKNTGLCQSYCTPSDAKTNGSPDGYKACNGWNETITVYRQSTYTPVFINGYEYQMTNGATNESVEIAGSGGNFTTKKAAKRPLNDGAGIQRFKIVSESGKWKLQLKADATKCIDSWWGTGVNVAPCTANNTAQQFTVNADSKGRFTLANVANGNKVLGINGGNLEFQTPNGSDSQSWKMGAVDVF